MEKCKADSLLKTTNTVRTEARETILRMILESDRPLSANELHSVVRDRGIDLATVYRALKLFTEKGLVRPVHTDGGLSFYEKSCEHNPPHPHFVCEGCGQIECLKPYGFDESALFMKMGRQKEVRSVELVLKGWCETCGN
ncbi:Fur family transcriptional regulator [Seleniivibrio woodruffii]|uniref:Fur family ferric uptake transcriptional regulator n=1 Tax=Seleniivibrio woodruffii TaxID=1078050 RepID=A0A4R1KDE3_9BACT|nr:Fur family transcriptional regulator [Seleniivibrio woodruffii]TCK62117.1 Fur family ferric uptake transcriptional regulator [Seleniivibrio woodruffii]TVZ34766.1 Fur family ferric uptake transcriptional regulator [Seleniivibrio woodruffii]